MPIFTHFSCRERGDRYELVSGTAGGEPASTYRMWLAFTAATVHFKYINP
jgi:hypothetical protein